jgi:hypothetical protein
MLRRHVAYGGSSCKLLHSLVVMFQMEGLIVTEPLCRNVADGGSSYELLHSSVVMFQMEGRD